MHCAQATLTAFVGAEKEQLHAALEGCDLVTMTAGVARKPGMTRDDLFDINAGIVKGALPSLEHSSPPVARRL